MFGPGVVEVVVDVFDQRPLCGTLGDEEVVFVEVGVVDGEAVADFGPVDVGEEVFADRFTDRLWRGGAIVDVNVIGAKEELCTVNVEKGAAGNGADTVDDGLEAEGGSAKTGFDHGCDSSAFVEEETTS